MTFHLMDEEEGEEQKKKNKAMDGKLKISELSIIAGHFAWDIWKILPACQQQQSLGCEVHPIIIGRHPVDRIISYYYQRFYLESGSPFYQKRLNDLNPIQWENLIISHRFARYKDDNTTIIVVDEGLKNAFCRTLLNKRTTTGLHPSQIMDLPEELTNEDIELAIQHVKESVVGLLEEWEMTLEIIDFWFPWISFSKQEKAKQLNQWDRQKQRENKENLNPIILEIILKHNQCDLIVYEAILQRFQQEVEFMNYVNSMISSSFSTL